jgi:hypothetical protein
MDVLIVSVVVHHLNLSVPWWYRRIIFSCLCVVVGRGSLVACVRVKGS